MNAWALGQLARGLEKKAAGGGGQAVADSALGVTKLIPPVGLAALGRASLGNHDPSDMRNVSDLLRVKGDKLANRPWTLMPGALEASLASEKLRRANPEAYAKVVSAVSNAVENDRGFGPAMRRYGKSVASKLQQGGRLYGLSLVGELGEPRNFHRGLSAEDPSQPVGFGTRMFRPNVAAAETAGRAMAYNHPNEAAEWRKALEPKKPEKKETPEEK